ncbi:MAG TPA: hypothetical protein VM243_11185, partial [Phycisphaerae bacterium]|nr:hypothetical protein [Phycisphaerae bacterium]
MKTHKRNGNRLDLICAASDITFEAAAPDENGKSVPRFSMVAYTGGDMDLGWEHPTVVDLAGMDLTAQCRPVRF